MNDQYSQERANAMENEDVRNENVEHQPQVPENPAVMESPKTVVSGGQKPQEMLLDSQESQHFRDRWNEVQASFVDEPRSAVKDADALVSELMTHITQMIAGQRRTLETQWNQGDVSTEDLRQILQSYRAFFNRLLR